MYLFQAGDRVRSTCVHLGDIVGTVLRTLPDHSMEVELNGQPTLQMMHNWELVETRAERAMPLAVQQFNDEQSARDTLFRSPQRIEPTVSFNATRADDPKRYTLDPTLLQYVVRQLVSMGIAFEVGQREAMKSVLSVHPSRAVLVAELIRIGGELK